MQMHKFIECMILRNSVNAALQRAHVYEGNPNAKKKEAIREMAKKWLINFGEDYQWREITEESKTSWCIAVQTLANTLSKKFGGNLKGKRLRIGVAQKMISLYLKYLWLLGNKDKKPLFAVLDRGTMKRAHIKCNWTELDCIDKYKCIISYIEKFAKSQKSKKTGKIFSDGSEWEAENWNCKDGNGED